METRKIQKTNDMMYLYLPTKWCKKNSITNKSKINIQYNPDGSITLLTENPKKTKKELKLKNTGANVDVLHKLMIACYTSSAKSFEIQLDNNLDYTKILNQKNLVSLELVEVSEQEIKCETTIHVGDSIKLLQTILSKVKNLLMLIEKKAPKQLLERYEEEIDRNRLLIQKSVINGLINPTESECRAIDLHYISKLAQELEQIADHCINYANIPEELIVETHQIVGQVYDLIKTENVNLSTKNTLKIINNISEVQKKQIGNSPSKDILQIGKSLNGISEALIDWAIAEEVRER